MRYHLSAGESKVHSARLSRRPEPFSGILAGPAPTGAPGRRSLADTVNWKPTQDALETDGEARRAGMTVLLGIGASPGLTNLLARHSADQLDEVDYIQTVWGSKTLPGHLSGLQGHLLSSQYPSGLRMSSDVR